MFGLALLVLLAGCAKYNTYFNAKRAFDDAEHVRDEALRKHQDPPKPGGQQKTDYETAIRKAQKILDDYPGHSLTDDALFLQAKAWNRLESYRMSISKFDLLFTNFPATPYLEEALYLQGLNHLLIGSLPRSQEYLDRLAKLFPDSRFRAETRKVTGDNAFALEEWETAAESYRQYLTQKSGVTDSDRIGLKLASCYWELRQFAEAAAVLRSVSETTSSAELGFQARLLSARVNVKLGQYDLVNDLLAGLRDEAGIYKAQGDVALVEAENLLAQGRGEEASPVLENMPAEWMTSEVKARAAEMLGNEFMARGKWEEAKIQFQEALRRRELLDDPDRSRRLNGNLNDYLAAETALADAKGDRLARLKLLEANALLFGLGRPGRAAQLYLEAAADSAADSTDAARGLFGAMVAYRDYLARPDSADLAAAELQRRFPSSPQAYEAAMDQGGRDLLGYLLDLRDQKQASNLAALSPEELAALQEVGDFLPTASLRPARGAPGLRRQMVYLSRRGNLVFDPPAAAVRARNSGQSAGGGAGAGSGPAIFPPQAVQGRTEPGFSAVGGDSLMAPDFADSLGVAGPAVDGAAGSADQAGQDNGSLNEEDKEGKDKDGKKDQEEDEKEAKKRKEQEKEWDFLRSPTPAPRPGPGA